MRRIKYIIILIGLNAAFPIGLKALIVPQTAEMISLSSSGIAGNVDIGINPASIVGDTSSISFSSNEWLGGLLGSKVSYTKSINNSYHYFSFEYLGIDDIELRDEQPSDLPLGYVKSNWIAFDYANNIQKNPITLVIGISGGIDSSVTSTLCAKTNLNTIVVSMPIKQNVEQHSLSIKHIKWLKSKFQNVNNYIINLDKVFDSFKNTMIEFKSEIAFANSRSRLRMVTLYQIAQSNNGIVVGTGNKVEDFAIGFYTKYGDGGVDISPIADCTKTQVWKMGKYLEINQEIINAKPTDGLWDDSRNDEQQIGLSYEQIEEAMQNPNSEFYEKYDKIRQPNLHKMKPIPICKIKDD